jgi:hypothetical protein
MPVGLVVEPKPAGSLFVTLSLWAPAEDLTADTFFTVAGSTSTD